MSEKPAVEPRKVYMACRSGVHKDGRMGSSSASSSDTSPCPSKQAFVMNDITGGGRGVMVYRCVDCNHTWSVGVGGAINI